MAPVELHVEESGSGPAVVLLHAFPLSSAMWTAQREALADRVRVVTPDLRGFGGSPPGDGDPSLDAVQREHIERVLRECGWRINGAGNAAVRLGMHPNTLRFRIKKLGLVIPDRRALQAAASPGRS